MSLDFQRLFTCRATTTLIVLAATLSLLRFAGSDLSMLIADPLTWRTEPWRLFTTTLLHVGVMHLVFNLYWTAVFGMAIESSFGLVKTAGLFVLLAVASSAPQVAIAGPGIGLSGIGYGLFGFTWALSRFDPRHRGMIDSHTTNMFVVWFFVCIVLSMADIMPIANIAHAGGLVMGAALGWSVAGRTTSFGARFVPLLLVFLGLGAASTVLRTRFASADMLEMELQLDAYQALSDERFADAERQALAWTERERNDWNAWWVLGAARWSLGDKERALTALERAENLHDLPPEYAQFVEQVRAAVRGGSPPK